MPNDKAKRTIRGERRKRFVDWVKGWDIIIVSSIMGMIFTVLLGAGAIVLILSVSATDENETQREIMEVYAMCMNAKDNHADCVEWTLEQVD